MMFQFHIIGFVGEGPMYWTDKPVDIVLYAINQEKAIEKAEHIIGGRISTNQRKIIIKEKRCKDYCGVTCVDGHCPIALYNEDFTMFERKPSCKDCFYYKGCEDCYFNGTDMCEHPTEKGE